METTITEFLQSQYRDYSLYTIENRSIPSLVDGLKPTARKVLFVANNIWKTGSEKTLKVFQLSGAVANQAYYHHGDCLDPQTEILLSNGSYIKIIDWYEKFRDIQLEVVSYDEKLKQFVIANGHSPRIGQSTSLEYEIEMENGEIFKCTNNHPFLTRRGWVNAEDLKEDDEILDFNNHMKIKSIRKNILNEEKPFYDITVDNYHNFLIGKSMIITHNSSLSGVIINMAQSFKNSLPLLEEDGQFGSLRSPEPGAARYIGTKLSKNFRLLYKDFELVESKEEEGEIIEPKFFLPIIPSVLLNGSQGIAVGFSSNILNRNPNDLIEACVLKLKAKKFDVIKPYLKDFKGEFINDPENHKRWIIRGVFARTNTTTVKISELPPSMTYEKYEDILDDLVEKKLIASYDNSSKNNVVNYTIKFTRDELANLTDEKLIKMLKLEEANTEIFTTLDEYGKIKIFETDTEIINYFVDFRLGYYVKRKDWMLSKLRHELKILQNRGKFIRAILEGKLEIKNKSKEELIKLIEIMKLDLIEDSYDYLLRMPLWSLTKELFEKLKTDFTAKKEEIIELEKVEPKDMYLEDLKELKQKIKKI